MKPIALHPGNGHYFRYKNRPAVLVTSGEHYGAVLNAAFDYLPYLNELKNHGFNQTRTFSGTYREVPGSFNITDNTLAPVPGQFLSPWARSGTPGESDGGNRFDLTKWDPAYFRRLKDFLKAAGKHGIIVELVLFCPMYEEAMWKACPMNAANNINEVGDVPRNEVLTRKHRDLLDIQTALVRKIVAECRDFDNLYYEICNEPYFGGVTLDWQQHIAETIVDAERSFPAKHLIAQNIANGSAVIRNSHPAVSVFNFHYASPPDAVRDNYALNRPIAFDETGFVGTGDTRYRTDAWEFLLAGGAVYSHLDYSYTVKHPDGGFRFPASTPGGGGRALRTQLATLKAFIESFDFVRMRPDSSIVTGGVPSGATVRALAETGKQYALYLKGGTAATLTLSLPAGHYRAEWLHPRNAEKTDPQEIAHDGGSLSLTSPPYTEDIALRLVAARAGRRRGTGAGA